MVFGCNCVPRIKSPINGSERSLIILRHLLRYIITQIFCIVKHYIAITVNKLKYLS